ncbi:MAG: hypothetical protein Kow0029_15060 [Candidatus Rifleibacteriota bacterium]
MKSKQSCNKSFFLFLILITLCCTVVSGKNTTQKLLAPGTQSPTCILEATDGKRHSFPVSKKWNLVFYWSLFCHSCLDEMPDVQSRIASLGAEVETFFVSLDSKKMEKALKNFCKKRKLQKPILMEEIASGSFLSADQWGVTMTPSVFIVAPDGKIAYSHAGPMNIDQFFSDFENMKTASSTCTEVKEE